MANRGLRAAAVVGAPVLTLALVMTTAWLATSLDETRRGPMRFLPFTPPPTPPPAAPDTGGPPPTIFEHLSPLQAELRNALLPYSHAPLLLGAAYQGAAGAGDTSGAALECMTEAIYYEAGHEPDAGKRAVAQVVLNRAASPSFPHSICGVTRQGAGRPGCQFTFMCDGSLARKPDPASWAAARAVAEAALSGAVDTEVGDATHYHADYVVPVWAPTMIKLVKVGRHIFYRWPGAHLLPTAALPTTSVDEPPPDVEPAPASPPTEAAPSSPASSVSPAPGGAAAPSAASASPLPAPASPSAGAPSPDQPPRPAPTPPKPPPAPHRALPQQSLRTGPV